MSGTNGDNRNLFLRLKSRFGLYHVVFTAPKTYPEKLTLTLVEKLQLSGIENTDSKEELASLEWLIQGGRKKVRVNFKTDTDKINIVLYR